MSIAVTGGTGFIGRHVVAEFARRGLSPVVVGLPDAPVPPEVAGHRVIAFDLRRPPANAFELMGCPDTLVHLAWGGLPNYRSLHHFETELPAQYAFLARLVECGLRTLVVTGTCFEYGMQSGALHEGLDPRPANPYGFAKDTLRRQLEYLRQQKPFNVTWARLFYLYGEGQPPTSLWPQLKAAADEGRAAFSMSGGEQLRDYLPVTSVASYLVSLALLQQDHGIVNICSGTPVSVRTLVEGWTRENGWTIPLDFGRYPYPDYEPMAFWGDATKLRRLVPVADPGPASPSHHSKEAR